ncbi:MAG TPA: phosphate signaling complex protein PhoU [Phycisphaerales bacterium]|nr:phosphate signaling complex protein PhoU [Phycisphaerales bacterium]
MTMPDTHAPGAPRPAHGPAAQRDRDIHELKQRLNREAASAIGMVEAALEALWALDPKAAQEIRDRDERIDTEEVAIEEHCLRLMSLQQPFARAFRELTFVLKVNADVERIADHATGIAKAVLKLPAGVRPAWPAALIELGKRVPGACRSLLAALEREDAQAARQVKSRDDEIDALHKQLFDQTLAFMAGHRGQEATGLLIYRIGRDLERVGDLLANIAEDIVYLCTGSIVRHEGKIAPSGGPRP